VAGDWDSSSETDVGSEAPTPQQGMPEHLRPLFRHATGFATNESRKGAVAMPHKG
jgi:hypothetical protein